MSRLAGTHPVFEKFQNMWILEFSENKLDSTHMKQFLAKNSWQVLPTIYIDFWLIKNLTADSQVRDSKNIRFIWNSLWFYMSCYVLWIQTIVSQFQTFLVVFTCSNICQTSQSFHISIQSHSSHSVNFVLRHSRTQTVSESVSVRL